MKDSKEILFSMFWNHGRWKRGTVSPEEFEQAKRDGYVFEPHEPITHDETLKQLRELTELISPVDVANAFLYSLSTRKLEYRSALGSYWYARAIPEHHAYAPDATCCNYCHWNARSTIDELNDYNVLNFERYKWGGIRHTRPNYCLFDLQQFQKLPKVTPAEEDWRILYGILDTIKELEPQKKAGALRQLITKKKLLKSNTSELSHLLGILSICGILASEEAPCYLDRFVDVGSRSPVEHTNDLCYPLNRWYARDSVNQEWFFRVFGRHYQNSNNQ